MNLSAISKALAGAATAAIVGYLAKYGVTLDPAVSEAASVLVTALVSAVVGFIGVYIAPPNNVR